MGRGKRATGHSRPVRGRLPLTLDTTSSRLAPAVSAPTLAPPAIVPPLDRPQTSRNPAARERQRKEDKPELYCPRCLWMTGGGACPRHGGPAWTAERQQLARKRSRGEATAEELARIEELAGLAVSTVG